MVARRLAQAGKATRERIEGADEVYVSAASIVECEHKIEAGLLEADAEELFRGIAASGFKELPERPTALPPASAPPALRLRSPLVTQAMASRAFRE